MPALAGKDSNIFCFHCIIVASVWEAIRVHLAFVMDNAV